MFFLSIGNIWAANTKQTVAQVSSAVNLTDDVDYIIPANDDAIRAVKLIAGCMADAVLEARQGESFDEGEEVQAEEAAAEETVEAAEEAKVEEGEAEAPAEDAE